MRRDRRVDGQVFPAGTAAGDGMGLLNPAETGGRGPEPGAGSDVVGWEVGSPGGHARASPLPPARAASTASSSSVKTGMSRTRPVIRNVSRTGSVTHNVSG